MTFEIKDPIYEDARAIEQVKLQSLSIDVHNSRAFYFPIPPHWHTYIEMLYITSGSARCYINGEFFSASRGDLVFINPNQVHAIFTDEGQFTEYICIKFDPNLLHDAASSILEAKYVLPFTMAESNYRKVFSSDEVRRAHICELVEQCVEEMSKKSYGYEYAVRINIYRIFLWILRDWHIKCTPAKNSYILKQRDINILQRVFDYVDRNFQEELSTHSAARLCNMSYSYFSRHFKTITGKTFIEYINFVRVAEAEKKLLTTDLDITQIALQCGFSNISYFIKQFRRFKSITPKQYKKNFTQATENTK